MTRPFLFRGWDKKANQMLHWQEVDLCLTFNGKLYMLPEEQLPEDRFVIMQFTGLHDKAGKPIFEGDLVKQHMPSGEVWQGKVVFEQGAFRINEAPTEDDPKVYNKDLVGGLAEIIGNVWEDPSPLLHAD